MSDVTARNKANKRRGTAWESAIRDGIREMGLDAERLRLSGKEDEGDLVISDDTGFASKIIVEAKSGAMHPAEFVREAITEARNYERHRKLLPGTTSGIAIVKQRGKGVLDAYVLTTVREFFGFHDQPGSGS